VGVGGKTGNSCNITPKDPVTPSVIGRDDAAAAGAIPARTSITFGCTPAVAAAIHACATHLNLSATHLLRVALLSYLSDHGNQLEDVADRISVIADWAGSISPRGSRHLQLARKRQEALR
jgi:hypothetical protein